MVLEKTEGREEMTMSEIEELANQREEAIHQLLKKRQEIAAKLEKLQQSVAEVDELLTKLGYRVIKPRFPRGAMEHGVYEGKYKGNSYILRVKDGVGTVDGIPGKFNSLTAAAKAATGRPSISGPAFWRKIGRE